MGGSRRKISKEERQERDALMRVVNWVHVLVILRLFDDGWTTEQVALAYDKMHVVTGRTVIGHAHPNHGYVDENRVADKVYAEVTRDD